MAKELDGKLYLGWEDIQQAVDTLCKLISNSNLNITSITGLQRGGLIPAVMISHKLNLPYVHSVHPNTLVVDDICDTGKTLDTILEAPTAVLHYKPTASVQPTFYAKEVGEEWIVYPWERADSQAIQDYLVQ